MRKKKFTKHKEMHPPVAKFLYVSIENTWNPDMDATIFTTASIFSILAVIFHDWEHD